MAASDHLSSEQFPLSHVHGFPLPEDGEDSDWAQEHTQTYAQHGGVQGYVSHLAEDMKNRGQQEPVELEHQGEGHYTISDGNHRVAAARLAGLTHIRARLVQ